MKYCNIAVLLLALTLTAGAQAPTGGMPTLEVARFSALENQLNAAMASGNRKSAAALLTGDFEEWTPQPPGSPISRQDWLKAGSHEFGPARRLQMAVKTLDDHAVADFVAIAGDKAFFVVDVWQKQGSEWRLQQRYRAPVDAAPYRRTHQPPVKY
jgi:hypothetical protein